MFRRRVFPQVLLSGLMLMLFSRCLALDSGVFQACLEDVCNSTLANSPCLEEHNECLCTMSNNSSACITLDQQLNANSAGVMNETVTQWNCCYCALYSTYCCNKCNDTSSSEPGDTTAAAPPELVQPSSYFRVLLVFVLECDQFTNEEDKLNASLKEGLNSLTSMPLDQITVTDISCTTGQRPYCGVDVPGIRAHHRAKRLAVGGRMRGGKTKRKTSRNSYSSYSAMIDVTCESMAANITIYGKNITSLEVNLDLLRQLQLNDSLVVPLWDASEISSSFMLSAMEDISYMLHEAPAPESKPPPPTENMPPLVVDLTPMIYVAAAIGGLFGLCVLWKFIKHSWLLSRKKFTPINSDRVEPNKTQQLTKQQKINLAMEENDRATRANENAVKANGLPQGDDEATKPHHNWSSPGFPARSLVPAYKPTELHNQRSPPRLILDEEGSDMGEDRRSIDSASVVNLGDDENLSDILNSDDERVLRPSSEGSHFSQGIKNPGFTEDSANDYMEEKSSKLRRKLKSISPRPSGSPNLSARRAHEERKESPVSSSDLSLDAGEQTVFLPVKKEKNTKKQEKPKKNKSFLSATNAEKPIRRSSITPVNDEKTGSRRNSATDPKSLTAQAAEGEKRRKSITNAVDNDRKIATPKDTYTRGKKTAKASALEIDTKLIYDREGSDVGENDGSGKNRIGRAVSPVNALKKSISIVASGGNGDGPGKKKKKIDVPSATPLNERRRSAVADVEQKESPGENRSKMNETSKNGTAADDSKKKKKKKKEKKETKKKTTDSDDSLDEAMASIAPSVTAGFTVTPATPEMSRRPSAALQEKESKVKKKKKRKDREEKKRKSEDSDASDEGEMAEDKIKDLSVEILPDTKRQKKKKQKGRKSEIPEPEATNMNRETNGSFVQSAKPVKMDSLTVTPEKKRKKSLVIEDMETKSQTSEEGSSRRRKSVNPGDSRSEIPAEWRKPVADSMVPNSISPLLTGYKSPRLIIKPNKH